jgi:hypothetical protein
MAYPATITDTTLTNQQSNDAIAAAEASILQCMSYLFYNTGTTAGVNNYVGTLVYNIVNAVDENEASINIDEQATLVKDLLCAFACKEFAIADILNSLSCRLSLENGSMNEDCDCGCKTR